MYGGEIPQPQENKLLPLARRLTKVRMTDNDLSYSFKISIVRVTVLQLYKRTVLS